MTDIKTYVVTLKAELLKYINNLTRDLAILFKGVNNKFKHLTVKISKKEVKK